MVLRLWHLHHSVCSDCMARTEGIRESIRTAAGYSRHRRHDLLLDRAARLRFHPLTRDHQSPDPKRSGHPLPLDTAAESLLTQLHTLFRKRGMVSPQSILGYVCGSCRRHGIRAIAGVSKQSDQGNDPVLRHGPVYLLHGLSRRTGAPETAPQPSDFLLRHDRAGRRARRSLRCADRAARL